MSDALHCTCDPEVFTDGSKSHEYDCLVYPWCPHESGWNACPMPCGCKCDACVALTAVCTE